MSEELEVKVDMELRRWHWHILTNGAITVTGRIYNDYEYRFDDGDYVTTSVVKEIFYGEDFVPVAIRTKNSCYVLERYGKG